MDKLVGSRFLSHLGPGSLIVDAMLAGQGAGYRAGICMSCRSGEPPAFAGSSFISLRRYSGLRKSSGLKIQLVEQHSLALAALAGRSEVRPALPERLFHREK